MPIDRKNKMDKLDIAEKLIKISQDLRDSGDLYNSKACVETAKIIAEQESRRHRAKGKKKDKGG
jgi:hypothetical protein